MLGNIPEVSNFSNSTGSSVTGVELPAANHLRDFAPDFEKYKAMQNSHVKEDTNHKHCTNQPKKIKIKIKKKKKKKILFLNYYDFLKSKVGLNVSPMSNVYTSYE